MATRIQLGTAALAAAICCMPGSPGTAASFVYEGRLEESGAAATGRYDFEVRPYADAALGGPIASAVRFEGVEVVGGRFRLDFELPEYGAGQVWLGLAVRGHRSNAGYAAFQTHTKAIEAKPIGLCWTSTSDSNTNPAVNFLGTTDAQPLVLRSANAQSLRIEPSSIGGGEGNVASGSWSGVVVGTSTMRMHPGAPSAGAPTISRADRRAASVAAPKTARAPTPAPLAAVDATVRVAAGAP